MRLVLSAAILFTSFVCHAQNIIPSEAKKHMGEIITVCGKVSSVQTSQDLEEHPTVIGFGPAFPNNNFSIVVLQEDVDAFSYKLKDLKEKSVCVTGTVVTAFGKPGIFVFDPTQIEDDDNQ